MNIVCATDDNFVQHCCIMLVSLLYNNKDVNIYVLTEGLKKGNQKIIENEVNRYNGQVHFCIVDSSIVEKFPMPKNVGTTHISRATYYRLLMPDLLPKDVEKILYLDCDIVINKSIEELWNIDITNYALAAVPQIAAGKAAERLGYPMEYGYFNAGVNLLNLKYWRENDIENKLVNYLYENYDRIVYHDQDALNAVLHDKCLHILPQWNQNSNSFDRTIFDKNDVRDGVTINDYKKEKENIKQYRHNPVVIHFVSKPKPWNKNCIHPMYHYYYDYARKTQHFCHIKPQNKISRLVVIIKAELLDCLASIKHAIIK